MTKITPKPKIVIPITFLASIAMLLALIFYILLDTLNLFGGVKNTICGR